MKRSILIALICGTALLACKKDRPLPAEGPKNVAQKRLITFKPGFSVSHEKIGKAPVTEIRDLVVLTQLTYLLYDAEGNEISRQTQTPNFIGYGNFQDSLIDGTYRVAVIGSNSQFGINSRYYAGGGGNPETKSNFSEAYWEYARGLDPWYRTEDTYYHSETFEVGDQSPMEISLILQRIVGRLEINIEDAIPENAQQVNLFFSNENHHYHLESGVPSGDLHEDGGAEVQYLFKSQDFGKTNFRVGAYVLNTTRPMDVSIIAYNVNGIPTANIVLHDIRVQKNSKTILSGKLFDPVAATNSTTKVNFNTEWDAETVVGF